MNNEDTKLILKIFLILFGVWFIDFLTTVYALNFTNGLIERNIIHSYFFNFGIVGWIISFLIVFVVLLSYSITLLYFFNRTNKYHPKFSKIILYGSITIYVFLEILGIINNISNIYKVSNVILIIK